MYSRKTAHTKENRKNLNEGEIFLGDPSNKHSETYSLDVDLPLLD